jgi:HPt (histidine-containing phosphotransfer) domain-containing protein
MQLDKEIAQTVYDMIPDARSRQEQYVVDTSEVDRELLDIFIEQLDINIKGIAAARAKGDMTDAANEAHSIKGMGGTAGMPELSVLAEDLEKAARAGDENRVEELSKTLDSYFSRVTAFVNQQ